MAPITHSSCAQEQQQSSSCVDRRGWSMQRRAFSLFLFSLFSLFSDGKGRVRARAHSATMAAASKRTLAWKGSSVPRRDWCALTWKNSRGVESRFRRSHDLHQYVYMYVSVCTCRSRNPMLPALEFGRKTFYSSAPTCFKITQSGRKPFWESI